MILEVKQWPESQEVMDNPEWFFIGDYGEEMIIGGSAYARVLDESEYILVEKTTADELNKEYAEDIDLQAFAQGRKSSFDESGDYISCRDPGDEHKGMSGKK